MDAWNRRSPRHGLVLGTLALVSAGCAAGEHVGEQVEAVSSASFTVLERLGDPVPGPRDLRFTFDFEPGRINDSGQVSFGADLTPNGVDNIGEGVFLRDPDGTLSALALAQDPAPPPDTEYFDRYFLGSISLNEAGDVPFAFLRVPEPGEEPPALIGVDGGVYFRSHVDGQVRPIALPGDHAPPAPDGEARTFAGAGFHAAVNNLGVVAFAGVVTPVDIGPGFAFHLGEGIYRFQGQGPTTAVVQPGDPAPGGKTFDWMQNPWINDAGDVAFGGHVAEEPCVQFSATPVGETLFCAESIYEKTAGGEVLSIAHIGDAAPGGGRFLYAFGPQVNNQGQIAFFGALPAQPPGRGHLPADEDHPRGANTGIFLYTGGSILAVARPGDFMPGGGRLATASFGTMDLGLNDEGVVSFTALLNNGKTGLYKLTGGELQLIARTGTVIPGVGTVVDLRPDKSFSYPYSGAAINDLGQIVFSGVVETSKQERVLMMLLASPGR